jgi:hypothetical protein
MKINWIKTIVLLTTLYYITKKVKTVDFSFNEEKEFKSGLETVITDWLMTDLHLRYDMQVLQSMEKDLQKGKPSRLLDVYYYFDKDTYSVGGEIIGTKLENGIMYVKCLLFPEILNSYEFDIKDINSKERIYALPLNMIFTTENKPDLVEGVKEKESK